MCVCVYVYIDVQFPKLLNFIDILLTSGYVFLSETLNYL